MRTYAIDGAKLAPEPKPPAQDTARHTPKAAANHLSAAERTKVDAGNVERDAAALDRTLASGKRLDPPGRKPRRDWREAAAPHIQTCNECGRSIMPHEQHYADQVSRHLVRHVACHEKAGA